MGQSFWGGFFVGLMVWLTVGLFVGFYIGRRNKYPGDKDATEIASFELTDDEGVPLSAEEAAKVIAKASMELADKDDSENG